MEQEFVNWFHSAPSNGAASLVLLGMFFMLFLNLSTSFIDYLTSKSWEVYDLKKIIAENVKTYDVDSNEDKRIVAECGEYYDKFLLSKERRFNFKNKLKNLFKRK